MYLATPVTPLPPPSFCTSPFSLSPSLFFFLFLSISSPPPPSLDVPNSCHVEVDSTGRSSIIVFPPKLSDSDWQQAKHFHFSFHLIIHIFSCFSCFSAAVSCCCCLHCCCFLVSLLSARQVFILGLNFAAWRVVVNFRFGGARPRRLLVHTHTYWLTPLHWQAGGWGKLRLMFLFVFLRLLVAARQVCRLSLSFVFASYFVDIFARLNLTHSHTHTHWHSHFLSFLFVVVVAAPLLTAKPLPFSVI